MTKKKLKTLYKKKRKNLSPKTLEDISENISSLLFQHFNLENKIVSIFLPIEKEREINTYLILEKALSINTKVVIPKMNKDNLSITHFLFKKDSKLELNSYGIPEIIGGRPIAADSIDVIIIPLFVSDKNGYRVGYGKGIYDKFLLKCKPNCQFIGISHFDEFKKIDDIHNGDIKLHYLITPEKVYKFPFK